MVEDGDKARVFISYSRRDLGVAEKLRDTLIREGFNAYLDIHDIKPGEPWQERLGALISTAEKVVFLISPESVASEICAWEVDHAERLGKSLLPVMVRETATDAIPGRLSRLNFIFMRDVAECAQRLSELTGALHVDLAWEREKTRINDLATAWDKHDRTRRLLMFSEDAISVAERWRDSHPSTSPGPTETQLAFISESRRRQVRRQRVTIFTSVAVAMVTAALSVVAFSERKTAIENEARAEAQRDETLLTESRLLAGVAQEFRSLGDLADAMALARRALPLDIDNPRDRPLAIEPLQVLYDIYHERRERRVLRGVGHAVPLDGRRVLIESGGSARIWDVESGSLGAAIPGPAGLPADFLRQLSDGRIAILSGDLAQIWSGDTMEPGPILRGHEDQVLGVERLRDERLLTWSFDGTARLWDGTTGAPGLVLRGHKGPVMWAEALGDGWILTNGDKTDRVWDARTGVLVSLFGREGAPSIGRTEPLSDGRILSIERDGAVRIWNAEAGTLSSVLLPGGPSLLPPAPPGNYDGRPGGIVRSRIDYPDGERAHGARQLADGRILTWSADMTARLFQMENGEAGAVLRGHSDAVEGAIELSGGRLLTWSKDATARIWDADTGASGPMLRGHDGAVTGALQLADGRIVTWGLDGAARVWDGETGTPGPALSGHEGGVEWAAALDEDRLLTFGRDKTARIWDIGPEDPPGRWVIEGSNAVALSDGRLLLRGTDGAARLWDSVPGPSLEGHEDFIVGARLLSDERILTWSSDGTARTWDGATGATGLVLRGHDKWVLGGTVHSDGRLLTWSGDGTARLWDGETGAPGPILRGHDKAVTGASVLSDGQILTWGEDGTARLWNGTTGSAGAVLRGHEHAILGIAERGNGSLLSWGEDGTVRRWDGATGGMIDTIDTHVNRPLQLGGQLLADGSLVTWVQNVGRLWNAQTGAPGPELRGARGGISGAIGLPDGRILTWGGERVAHLWNDETGALEMTLRGHSHVIQGALALEDGRILTWSLDRTARLWDGETGAPGPVLRGFTGAPAGALSRRADSRLLVWNSEEAWLWPGTDAAMVAETDQALDALDPLTVAERCLYFLERAEVCAIVGDDWIRTDATEALLDRAESLLSQRDPGAEDAFALAIATGGDSITAQIVAIRAAVEARLPTEPYGMGR